MSTQPAKPNFEFIYQADGICTTWDCGKQGVTLAYDTFSPEVAHWFCPLHWPDYEGVLTIVEDKRPPAIDPTARSW
jgi:hypothetical protein